MKNDELKDMSKRAYLAAVCWATFSFHHSLSKEENVKCSIREGVFSRRFTSRIHEISDLRKTVLVLSLRAEYTGFRETKNSLSTRGTLKR